MADERLVITAPGPQGSPGVAPGDYVPMDENGAVAITNSGTDAALGIDQNGDTSNSTSVGGAINLDNTDNTGAGLIIYSNQGAPTGRLLNIRADNATFNQAALHVDYQGSRNAVEITHTSVAEDGVALNVAEDNPNATAVGVRSNVETHGQYKSIHDGTGTDESAAHISLDFQGVGTKCQGIFMTSTAGGGTTGKLLNLRNGSAETEYLTLTYDGRLGLSEASPVAILEVNHADQTGVTEEIGLIRSQTQALTLTDGTVLPTWRQNRFMHPTISNPNATVDEAATVYIDAAPNGDAAFTNEPNALWVGGQSRFDGDVAFPDNTTGVVLTSPNGSQYRLTVDDTGALSTDGPI